ncbi:MAG: L,D-transpeptidase family protein [Chloroflexota bacterium]
METRNYLPPPASKQRRPKAKHNHRTLWLVGGGAAALVVVFVLVGFALLFVLALMPDRIATGVAVASIPLGGKTSSEASAALQQNLAAQPILLTDGDRDWSVSPADLGVSIDTTATLQDAEDAAPNTIVTPRYGIDLTAAQSSFVSLSEQINVDAIPGRNGRSMDIPVMLDRLRSDAAGEIADGTFELNMIELPAPTPETASSYTGETTRYTVQQGQELGLIAKDYNVAITDIMALNEISNPDLIYPGQELIIPAAGEYIPEAPPAPTNSGRSIVVSTENQRIYAYENGQVVRTHLVSTGLPATPTVKGDYAVYVKYTATDMSGPDYFLPQVPYTMYFYAGYGIHGTYWHNAFGRPMSHGCVNLPTDEAEWFFNFASVGTPVRVI